MGRGTEKAEAIDLDLYNVTTRKRRQRNVFASPLGDRPHTATDHNATTENRNRRFESSQILGKEAAVVLRHLRKFDIRDRSQDRSLLLLLTLSSLLDPLFSLQYHSLALTAFLPLRNCHPRLCHHSLFSHVVSVILYLFSISLLFFSHPAREVNTSKVMRSLRSFMENRTSTDADLETV
ncbi:hypothetical protein BGW80DRAFT_838277 [Lactifluus volemus]|nr:hypothetical protein BGW80DRAFT_838277 [Lactifluus volemus]